MYKRQFKFRSATKKLRKRLVGEAWEKVEVEVEGYLGELPFTPVDVVLDIEDFRRRFEPSGNVALTRPFFQCGANEEGSWSAYRDGRSSSMAG